MDQIANSLAERLSTLLDNRDSFLSDDSDTDSIEELMNRLVDCPTEDDCLEAISILSIC